MDNNITNMKNTFHCQSPPIVMRRMILLGSLPSDYRFSNQPGDLSGCVVGDLSGREYLVGVEDTGGQFCKVGSDRARGTVVVQFLSS